MLFLQAQTQQAVTEVAGNSVLTEVVETATEMNLWDMATKGGWIMIVLALLSVLCVYIFVERLVVMNKASKVDPVFMERIHDYVRNDELKSAINYCRITNTPASNMIEKGLERIDRPASEVQATLENAGNLEVAKLEKGLSVMATVLGMVRAFWEMANAGNNIDITLLSSGIYEAMITTVGGLVVGIVAMFAYNYLVSRVNDVANVLEAQTLSFMDLKN